MSVPIDFYIDLKGVTDWTLFLNGRRLPRKTKVRGLADQGPGNRALWLASGTSGDTLHIVAKVAANDRVIFDRTLRVPAKGFNNDHCDFFG